MPFVGAQFQQVLHEMRDNLPSGASVSAAAIAPRQPDSCPEECIARATDTCLAIVKGVGVLWFGPESQSPSTEQPDTADPGTGHPAPPACAAEPEGGEVRGQRKVDSGNRPLLRCPARWPVDARLSHLLRQVSNRLPTNQYVLSNVPRQ